MSSESESQPAEKQEHPVGFFDSRLKRVRLNVFGNVAFLIVVLMAFLLGVLSLYWGVQFDVERNMPNLTVFVVDFDGQVAPYNNPTEQPLVGPLVVQAAEKLASSGNMTLGWSIKSPTDFNNDPLNVRESVYNFNAWAAIIINANASALLRSALTAGNASYDPLGALQTIYVEARDDTTMRSYVIPQLDTFQTEVTSMFGKMWGSTVLGEAQRNATIFGSILNAPQIINPGIGFSTFNLRPFGPAVIVPAESVGLIYLIIVAFFSFGFFIDHHSKFIKSEDHPPLIFWQWIIWRWVSAVTVYFFLSLAYSLVSLAYQIPFNDGTAPSDQLAMNPNPYGRATFVVYWMLNFVGMTALGLPCENVAMIIGQPWMSLWLIFWVITNVSTSFYAIDLAPGFYKWGYAWPLHNVVEASRMLLFDLYSRIGLNFGILFAWIAVSTVLYPFCCYFAKWKSQK